MKQLGLENCSVSETTTEIRQDKFRYMLVREASYSLNDPLVRQAQRIQAEGYTGDKDFVEISAVEEDGRLPEDIDKARGKYVDYIIGIPKDSPYRFADPELDCAVSVRKLHIPEDGNLEDLPSYKMAKENIWPEYREYLESIGDVSRVKEIAALSKLPGTDPRGIFEILRAVHQEALGKDEVWVFCIVSSTYGVFKEQFGSGAIQQIGDPVGFEDERIKGHVQLIPALLHPDLFIDELRRGVENAADEREAERIGKNLMFYTQGLTEAQVDEKSFQRKHGIINALGKKAAS